MAEKVQQQETLHLETDVRIDHDPQAVEDACSRRLEIAVLNGETVFHDTAADRRPDVDQLVNRHVADPGASDFVTEERLHDAASYCASASAIAPRHSRPAPRAPHSAPAHATRRIVT